MKVLVLYASKRGSNQEVAEFIQQVLEDHDVDAHLANANGFSEDIGDYDALLIGSPMYKGLWLHEMIHTMRRLLPQLAEKPVWGWSICVRVLEPNGEAYARLNYLPTDIISKLNLQEYQFFAGKLEDISAADRNTLDERYDGHFLYEHFGDHRNWEQIRAWVEKIATDLQR